MDHLRRHLIKYGAMTDSEFDRVASLVRWRRVEKGSSILVPGEVCSFEGFVTSGCLRVYFSDQDGSQRVLYFAPEGWWVTDIESFLSETPAALGIDAVEQTDLLVIDRPDIDRLRELLPTFERLLTGLAEQTLMTLQRRMIASMRKTAAQRYQEFVDQYPSLEARIPQYQIAAYIGVSPEFLSKLRKDRVRRQ